MWWDMITFANTMGCLKLFVPEIDYYIQLTIYFYPINYLPLSNSLSTHIQLILFWYKRKGTPNEIPFLTLLQNAIEITSLVVALQSCPQGKIKIPIPNNNK